MTSIATVLGVTFSARTGVYQVQSGSPFPVRSNDDFAGVGPGSGNQFWNLVGDPTIARTPFTTTAVWFNPAAFAHPTAGTLGVQSRNALRNPHTWNLGAWPGVGALDSM